MTTEEQQLAEQVWEAFLTARNRVYLGGSGYSIDVSGEPGLIRLIRDRDGKRFTFRVSTELISKRKG